MKSVLHTADSRGQANHGWLESRHTFSFANYHNPDRMNFGLLRVLNDDIVSGGMGFGTHPHQNMEIISIPLEGELLHKDDKGNEAIIKTGDIQVMSAGSGIEHSEKNASSKEKVKFLQIWIFPNKPNVTPRYDQVSFSKTTLTNQLKQVLSPNQDDDGVWIHQNAWFHISHLDKANEIEYNLRDSASNGVYIFVLSGSVHVGTQELNERDGLGLWELKNFTINAHQNSELLIMEVPMNQS